METRIIKINKCNDNCPHRRAKEETDGGYYRLIKVVPGDVPEASRVCVAEDGIIRNIDTNEVTLNKPFPFFCKLSQEDTIITLEESEKDGYMIWLEYLKTGTHRFIITDNQDLESKFDELVDAYELYRQEIDAHTKKQ